MSRKDRCCCCSKAGGVCTAPYPPYAHYPPYPPYPPYVYPNSSSSSAPESIGTVYLAYPTGTQGARRQSTATAHLAQQLGARPRAPHALTAARFAHGPLATLTSSSAGLDRLR